MHRNHEKRQSHTKRGKHRFSTLHSKNDGNGNNANSEGYHKPLRGTENVATFPWQQWSEGHCKQERDKERREREIEKRRTHRNLVASKRFKRQRI